MSLLELSYLHYNVGYELVPSLLGHCKQKQRGLRGLLCR